MNISLFISVVMIWGSTWLAIALQVEHAATVAPEISVFYRFAIAAILQLAFVLFFKKMQRVPLHMQGWVLLLGICLFCLNFLFFYNAARYIPSGLISVIFSMATIISMFNGYLFYRRIPTAKMVLGAVVGISGVMLIFGGDLIQGIKAGENIEDLVIGLLLVLGGTYCFSAGNFVSQHLQKQNYSIMSINSYALVYGTLLLGAWGVFQGYSFEVPVTNFHYMGVLFYLAVPGTLIGFGAYLLLVGRIGAETAAYATVLFPIVALCLSAIFEGFTWNTQIIFGILFVLGGNVIIFTPRKIWDSLLKFGLWRQKIS